MLKASDRPGSLVGLYVLDPSRCTSERLQRRRSPASSSTTCHGRRPASRQSARERRHPHQGHDPARQPARPLADRPTARDLSASVGAAAGSSARSSSATARPSPASSSRPANMTQGTGRPPERGLHQEARRRLQVARHRHPLRRCRVEAAVREPGRGAVPRDDQVRTASRSRTCSAIPPHMVTDATGAKGYVTGVMASRMDWHQTGLLPRIIRWERAISRAAAAARLHQVQRARPAARRRTSSSRR